jgi:hypothetical protein
LHDYEDAKNSNEHSRFQEVGKINHFRGAIMLAVYRMLPGENQRFNSVTQGIVIYLVTILVNLLPEMNSL